MLNIQLFKGLINNIMINFSNQTALVTGGLGNLGLEICKSFLENDIKNLIVIDINDKNVGILQALVNSEINQKLFFIKTDLSDITSAKISIKELLDSVGSLNIVVNNAAFVGNSKLQNWNVDYLNQSVESWNLALQLNLTVPNEIIKICLDYLKKSNEPSILNIGSIYGSSAPDWKIYEGTEINNPLAYNVSKAGVIQLTKYLATYLTRYKIRINTLSPGGIFANQDPKFVSKYIKETPMGRMATFPEIGRIAAALNSNLFSHMTGQNIIVDGGFTL